jgi:hypothetical protein
MRGLETVEEVELEEEAAAVETAEAVDERELVRGIVGAGCGLRPSTVIVFFPQRPTSTKLRLRPLYACCSYIVLYRRSDRPLRFPSPCDCCTSLNARPSLTKLIDVQIASPHSLNFSDPFREAARLLESLSYWPCRSRWRIEQVEVVPSPRPAGVEPALPV